MLYYSNQRFFRRFKLFDIIIILIIIYVLLPANMFFYPFNGLDPSWMIAINLAIKEQLVFGRDFIFTCGPLGFLWTGMFIHVPIIYIVTFHLILLISLIFILSFYLKKLPTPLSKIFFALIILLTSTNIYFEKALMLLLIFLFFLFYYLENKKRNALYFAGFISLITFFIKLNTGLVITASLLVFVSLLPFIKYEKISFSFGYLTTYILSIFIASYFLRVDVLEYLINSLHIIMQYNEGNSLPAPLNILLLALLILLIFGSTIFLHLKQSWLNTKRNIVLLFTSGALFIVFKEGFVRADAHMMIFFAAFIPFTSLIYFFQSQNQEKKHWTYSILVITVICAIATQIFFPAWGPFNSIQSNINKIPYEDFITHEYPEKLENTTKYCMPYSKLPDRVLNKLDGKNVDIIPWDSPTSILISLHTIPSLLFSQCWLGYLNLTGLMLISILLTMLQIIFFLH